MHKMSVNPIATHLAATLAVASLVLAGCAGNTTQTRDDSGSIVSSTPVGGAPNELDQPVVPLEHADDQAVAADMKKSAPFEEIVCERIERTGSHRVQRVCYTVVQSEQNERKNRNAIDRLNRNNGCVAGCSAGVKKSLENVPN